MALICAWYDPGHSEGYALHEVPAMKREWGHRIGMETAPNTGIQVLDINSSERSSNISATHPYKASVHREDL